MAKEAMKVVKIKSNVDNRFTIMTPGVGENYKFPEKGSTVEIPAGKYRKEQELFTRHIQAGKLEIVTSKPKKEAAPKVEDAPKEEAKEAAPEEKAPEKKVTKKPAKKKTAKKKAKK